MLIGLVIPERDTDSTHWISYDRIVDVHSEDEMITLTMTRLNIPGC